ncbi:sensor histidine kinase [Paenibacillus lautus]|uniref:sensor histidine kinase n=1 Tax=Paenibacillus lautus TaxID=1401 RepID=UPI000FDCB455|nr:ATP-binding protein [Paenibacillus lautus]
MKQRLDLRLAVIIISITAGILIMFTVINIVTNHYHIAMFQQQSSVHHGMAELNYHLEQAQMQSIILTCLLSIAIASVIGMYVARRISAPLVQMKRAAEMMTRGNWDIRVATKGYDEIARLGSSLNELAVQLQKQELLRRNMTQDIAHELRTPLTTLKSHTRALADGIWEPTADRFQTCLEEIDRLIQLVTELEDLHDMESPEFQLSRSKQELGHIMERAITLAAAMYHEKKVDLQYVSGSPILAEVDADRMLQVLINMLSNALHYTPAGGTVQAELVDEGANALIRIKDSGQGISSSDLSYIFERLYRGDKSRNRLSGGSGMGLAIVKQLVSAHGGQVWAESGEKHAGGSCFYIRIPKEE